jgi:hypothetical protein
MVDRVPMTDLLDRARSTVDEMRQASAGALDGTDQSVWFVYGALLGKGPRAGTDLLAYAVYIADLLATAADSVEVSVEADGNRVREVTATRERRVQCVLTWVLSCVEDPEADNIVFKYACALRDFGQPERARVLDEQLAEFGSPR